MSELKYASENREPEPTAKVKDAEVVVETALAKAGGIEKLVKDTDKPLLDVMEHTSLDWKSLKPNQMAVLLMQKPFSVSGGGTTYLTFKQALYFAVRCFELGVSPFSNAVWFDPARYSVNLTLEGKKEVARNRNIDLGPPQFEEISRKWEDIPRMTEAATAAKNAGFTKDVGIKCSIRIGDPAIKENAVYFAYLSEWYVGRSPVWKEKPIHMLQTRATEKCISMALGTGSSNMPSEEEIGG